MRVFVDTETTGLNPDIHQIWQMAYAFETGPVRSSQVQHSLFQADDEALRINNYYACREIYETPDRHRDAMRKRDDFEQRMKDALRGNTLVAANPRFDTSFLRKRWEDEPYRYRTIDLETYAMPYLGLEEPKGLAYIAGELGVQAPDHSAGKDVATLRACFLILRDHYRLTTGQEPKEVELAG